MEISSTNKKTISFNVLLAAAGSGERIGGQVPKQYRSIAGKPLLRYTLEKFINIPQCKKIGVIINPEHKTLFEEITADLPDIVDISGGKDRNNSVFNGLESFSNLDNEEIILIHDAARPFVTKEEIVRLVEAVDKFDAATLATPVSDTLRHAEGGFVDRDGLWGLQTPQGFRYGLIKQAHESAEAGKSYTDDTSLVMALGHHVELVKSGRHNFKITFEEDFEMAEKMIAAQKETRTGSGFDVHAFDTEQKGPVRICGIDVDHPHRLKGHSDADVGLHALTDAILGAIGEGDIGLHFPPSDDQWKGADSKLFLEEAVKMLTGKGGRIINLDLTVICEAPKLMPHKDAMAARVAEICAIDRSRVNVKATTTEKLGFTGRGEGIAAQAVATVEMS